MEDHCSPENMRCLSREQHVECDHVTPEDKLKYELHYAATRGNMKQVKRALRKIGDVNSSYTSGLTALHLFCLNGYVKCVKDILKLKPDVNIRDDSDSTPLNVYFDSLQCHTSYSTPIVEMLLKAGADPNALPRYQMAPLHMALENFDRKRPVRFVELLINHGADVNLQGMFGNTPLHFAISTLNDPAIDLLLRKGADIYLKNKRGVSPMDLVLTEMKGDLNMLTRLGKELIIMYYCGTQVHRKHWDAVRQIPSLRSFRSRIKLEVGILSSYKCSGFNITYYDILKSTTTKVAKYMLNSVFFDFLQNESLFIRETDYILQEEYFRKLNKAYEKYKVYISAHNFLKEVLPILPEICINNIIEYLDDKDLINMGKATSSLVQIVE
ncbi:hypothetical protein WA026_003688 [Henosepilachna vigintioctopunctata]|uniref:F-box domain-containing protein n=1 Tax=Henosepilachna vigintioctopunctata TaxID=420089 RepID=A0AAW1U756_9CUCU